ncbi:MAG: DNA-directed RNA polymerase subunit beta [Chloroflexi bacterium RBG_13_54_9]|nr:MAG: DNA-directed RNA polymerase subunit beta [Chloroflexi bacterium RBG_13_54_9]
MNDTKATVPVEEHALMTKKSYAKITDVLEMPNLIQIQLSSFKWFQEDGLRELFQEISPIQDFTGKRLELHFLDHRFANPRYSQDECRERDMTYSAPLIVKAQLINKETGEVKEQDLFMGDFPLMTPNGTFIVNGAERVVVSQLVRSPGVYFTAEEDPSSGRHLGYAKLIPNRGAWLEFETSNKDIIAVKVDRRRKIPITNLLRAIGLGSEQQLLSLFKDVDVSPLHSYIRSTIDSEPTIGNQDEALVDLYRRLRPGDPTNLDNARALIRSLFFEFPRYDLGRVGRYKLNKRLEVDIPLTQRVLTNEDIVEIVRRLIQVNNGTEMPDDIDHLGNRRVRAVGELIQNQFRIGLLRMERVVRERMTIIDVEVATPSALVNVRPVVAAMREFFGGSQLSQFMDQTNLLAELTHKRRLSALGPGGLSRERAGFDVRDVHHSHYGRICPIETPEGPNIGLIGNLATYGRINEYGFIETPYRKVVKEVPNTDHQLTGRITREAVLDVKGLHVVEAGVVITPEIAATLAELQPVTLKVVPFVSDEIEYLSADKEEQYIVAQANARLDEKNQFVDEKVEVRHGSRFMMETADKVDFMDVSPKQIVSVNTSLIPFLEHDDANRALMGANMQRQAVPLLRPKSPLVGTGMEWQVAHDSGQVIFSDIDGVVTSVTADEIVVSGGNGEEHVYPLRKFVRSNQGTCINQRPIVEKGDRVCRGQVLVDSSSTDQGELALGQSVFCAFMSWRGYNYEDAVIISESLVKEDKFSSIHIEKHEIESRDTKLGPEEITRDIPNVGEESLRNLDERGVIRVGAEVEPGDILVGKITPKGETELTAEEKLLRAIFGEKAREVKDTSLRVPHGERGKVIDVRVFSRADHDELPAGVNEMVRVSVAQRRKVAVGDKMAGRHGNKGVISIILPLEDMPFLADGTPIEIVLNPIGVPSRMNIGQLLETHLGQAAHVLGFKAMSPVFDGADEASIEDALARAWIVEQAGAITRDPGNQGNDDNPSIPDLERAKAWLAERGYDGEKIFDDNIEGEARLACLRLWLEDEVGVEASSISQKEVDDAVAKAFRDKGLTPPTSGKTVLYDGRTGEPFDQPVTVGYIYMMKLIHLVEDKMHARSTGPYSLITQQPLGGKAQFGGQRFGEMEVWALEAYGAAHVLQELITIKSDDVVGRVKAYEAIVKGEDILEPGVPESFKVLVKELQSLCLAVEVLNEDEEQVVFTEDAMAETPDLGINLAGFEEA